MVDTVGSVSAKVLLDTTEFEKAIETLKDDIDVIKQAFGQKTSGNGFADEVKKLRSEIDSLRKTTDDYKNKITALREQLNNSGKSFKSSAKEAETLRKALSELNDIQIKPKGLEALQNTLKKMTLDFKRDAAEINYYISKFDGTGIGLSQSETFSIALRALASYRKELMETTNIFSKWGAARLRQMTVSAQENETYAQTAGYFKKQQQNLNYLTTGYNKLTDSILRTTQVLSKFDFALLEGVSNESIFYQRTVQLASAMQRLSVQGSANWSGRNLTGGYSTYIGNITEITRKLEEQQKATEKVSKSTKTGQASMREFGTAMGKAEAYSNNLYRGLQKVRSVVISLKTIFGAMGAMALWGFATDLIEGAKETYRVKSEMESLLNANTKVDANGIKTFNNELDNTIKKFQKINKYSLGETAASIGLEFNLSAKEMSDSLEVIAMVQNEYARAGRSSEEAALAVKDILQGEFRRLSMETGIGKDDLIEKYGWSGAKEDVLGLMDALKKAGQERHWDLFAAKATSVGDVVNITKARFSEFGADLITTIEPMIVTAFNGMVEGIDNLKKGFEGMGTFGQYVTIGGLGLGAFTGISTALMILKRDMGLAQIATLGWGRSFGTALMGLNKTEVALNGFWKTLVATTAGVDASTVANMKFYQVLTGRIAGVDLAVQKEHGLLSAMVSSKMALQGELNVMNSTVVATGSWHQKLAYLIGNVKAADAASLKWHQSLLKIVTSTKMLKIALLGLTSVAIISYFAGMAAWADRNKKAMENYNKVVDEGKDIAEKAAKTVDEYTQKLSGLTEGTEEYNKVSKQLDIAKLNKQDIDNANTLSQAYEKLYEGRKKHAEEMATNRLNESYQLAGLDTKNAALAASGYEKQVKEAIDVRNKALKVYNNRLYQSSQHINEHVAQMKKAGAEEKDLVKYVTEYNAEARNTAELWRKFNEGDLNSGFYAILSEAKLVWIDLWNNDHFTNFWNSTMNTWKEVKPTVYEIRDMLINVGETLLDFFSTKQGQIIGGITATGLAFGVIGTKIYHLLGGAKSTIDIIKTLGGKLKDLSGRWKDVGDKAEEANTKMGGSTSTGGIKGKKYGGWKELGADIKQDFMGEARRFAKLAGQIALAMGVVTVAIGSLVAPLLALALVGIVFKSVEQQAKEGIEGIKLVAPVVLAFLVPVVALAKVIDNMGGAVSLNLKSTLGKTAQTLAVGMLLVAESIGLLVAPMLAIAGVGYVKGLLGDSVEKGKQAVELVTETLVGLYPIIPVFAAAILTGSIAIDTEGIGALYLAGSLAIGMGLVAVAVLTLSEPLLSIGALGAIFQDLSAVRKGAEAIKVTAESLKYLTTALGEMVAVDWLLLIDYVTKLIGSKIGFDFKLTTLTEEGGFFDEVNKFIKEFNKIEFEPIDTGRVESLNGIGGGLDSIATALKNANDAVNNIPPELRDPSKLSINEVYKKNTNGENNTGNDLTNYFDQLKEPLKQLKQFIDDFNTSEEFDFGDGVDTSRVDAINQSANMVSAINDAVTNVKNTLGNIATANVMGNLASMTSGQSFSLPGGLGAIVGLVDSVTSGGAGDYQSSIGSQLYEMELVIKDLNKFNSNITAETGSGGGGGGADVSGLTTMVTTVSDAIGKLKTTLSDAVPSIKENAKQMGSAIPDGFKEGLGNLKDIIVNPLVEAMTSAKDYAGTYGKGIGWQGTQGFKAEFKIDDAVGSELNAALQTMEGKKPEFYNKGYALGESMSQGFKDGNDMHSPGIMARSVQDEMNYIGQFLSDASISLPLLASSLAQTISGAFNTEDGGSIFQLPDLTQLQNSFSQVSSMASGVTSTVSTTFGNMKTTVGTALNDTASNATSKYTQIVNTTRTSLSNMQGQTTKNIGAIRTSWKGMQDALIESAETIRSQTSSKISALQSNMATFWRKVQNPALLLGGAGSRDEVKHTIRRRSVPKVSGGYAGSYKTGSKITGISNKFRSKSKQSDLLDYMGEYLQCLLSGGGCFAGGWNFDWSSSVKNSFMKWHTHFGAIYDDILNVAKFENDTFPVRGNAEIAKRYIYDAISRTNYDYYYDSHFATPLDAWNAGAFNCWDGARVIMALASAFGFGGGYMGHGSWGSDGHVWAIVPGLGIMDATAIQRGYGFKSPKVSGYGSHTLVNNGGKKSGEPRGETHNYGDVNLTINVYGDDVEVNENKVDKSTARSIIDLLGINPHTGV